jgi:hypothetical protein
MVGISKRFEKRALKSQGFWRGESVFSSSVNAVGAESKEVERETVRKNDLREGWEDAERSVSAWTDSLGD